MPMRQPNGIWMPTCSPASKQRGGAVDFDGLVGQREGDGAALAALVRSRDDEALHVEVVLWHPGVFPHRLDGVEHRRRTARPGRAVLPVRDEAVEFGREVEVAHVVGQL